MTDNTDKLNLLLEKLELLLQKQAAFSQEVQEIKREISVIKGGDAPKKVTPPLATPPPTPIVHSEQKPPSPFAPQPNQPKAGSSIAMPPSGTTSQRVQTSQPKKKLKTKSDLEKFIGENLINKIGIAILIIGVAIGAKYSIEHDLISPLTRIILGYITGIVLLGIGFKLKEKYLNYSAVLVSGAMAIMYFITYSAYAYYDLFTQEIAFGLMTIFTIFTVLASLNFNKQIIAHIGLVGAYAVPFLLSDGSGRVEVMFAFMAIVNAGVLFISFRKNWKPLLIVAFTLTWLIYFAWFLFDYSEGKHFTIALIFSVLFFVQFYVTFLANKLSKKQFFQVSDILLLFGNAFIFYGIGIVLLSEHDKGSELLGVFTLANGIVHFIVSAIIFKSKLADKNLIYLTTGLVLVFLTITFPVQLDGNWVTIFWGVEAALLFWIGRTKAVAVYEKLSFILMGLALLSLVHDWTEVMDYYSYGSDHAYSPLLNGHFVTALILVCGYFFILFINRKVKFHSENLLKTGSIKGLHYAVSAIAIGVIYMAFKIELDLVFKVMYNASSLTIPQNEGDYPLFYNNSDILDFKKVWWANYNLLFVLGLSVINMRKIRSRTFAFINLGFTAVSVLFFLMVALFSLSELRESYISQDLAEFYDRGIDHIIIRYISLTLLALTLGVTYMYVRMDFIRAKLRIPFEALLHITIWWVLSSELIHWLDMADFGQSYKLGLSILWGVYSLFVIVLGIWKRKQYLRIAAMALFGITLLKLFFYDIAHLDTLAKTIVFISLGSLLLIISFLYNKFTKSIGDDSTS
ncbi:MAG: putative membrane protein [Flavobacteriales bacterium]|jgi:uncharacterized membrane protein